jgi:hypothetical protein
VLLRRPLLKACKAAANRNLLDSGERRAEMIADQTFCRADSGEFFYLKRRQLFMALSSRFPDCTGNFDTAERSPRFVLKPVNSYNLNAVDRYGRAESSEPWTS